MALLVKNLPTNAQDIRDAGLIAGLGRSPGGGHDDPLQYSCLENPDGWRALEGKESDTTEWLSTHSFITCEGHFRKLRERFCPLDIQAQLSKFF